MSISINTTCKLLLHVDDNTVLFLSEKLKAIILEKLGQELQSCSQWCIINSNLSLHLDKTQCILFGQNCKQSKVDRFTVV